MTEPAYRPRWRSPLTRRAMILAAGATMLLASVASGLAQTAVPFSGGDRAGQDDPYAGAAWTASPATVVNASLYIYGTADDGNGYYTTWDGSQWSAWQGWEDQPVAYQWQPATAYHGDSQYVYYTGDDGKYYQNVYDGTAWSGWSDTSGAYTWASAPYASTDGTTLHLYGAATDGNLYVKSYDGAAWSEWAAVNDPASPVGAWQPYAVAWDGHENTFWTGEDGKAYWNRYDGTEWSGAREIPGDYTYADTAYAVGYDDALHAYASGDDGMPYYNTFDGSGWSGWATWETAPAAQVAYQPNAYVYEDAQHLVYTGQDGHAYYSSYDGTAWTAWADLGENYAWEPVQYAYGDGYYLAYTGEDGGLYYKTYAAAVDDSVEPSPTPEY